MAERHLDCGQRPVCLGRLRALPSRLAVGAPSRSNPNLPDVNAIRNVGHVSRDAGKYGSSWHTTPLAAQSLTLVRC
jgi:hypothetical protein